VGITEEEIMEMVVPVMVVAMLGIVAQTIIPQPQHVCPVCGQKFMTYDQLYQHFTTAHPAEPIQIIWQ